MIAAQNNLKFNSTLDYSDTQDNTLYYKQLSPKNWYLGLFKIWHHPRLLEILSKDSDTQCLYVIYDLLYDSNRSNLLHVNKQLTIW